MEKVSILMPCFNTEEQHLKEAIESILNQTYSNFEFIIIDDGSTNNAPKIIEEYAKKDKRIKFLRHITNQGCPDTRNELMEYANGEYIALMDSDDICMRERIEKEVNFLDENKNISMVGSYIKTIPDNAIIKYPKKIKYMDFLKGCCVLQSSVMYRRKDFEKFNLKYNTNFKTAEDYELWSRVVKHLKIATIEEALVIYRIQEKSLSHGNDELLFKNDKKVKENMLNFLTDDKILQEKISKLVFKHACSKNFLEQIFSIKNIYGDKKYKIITFFKMQKIFEVKNGAKPKN